MGGKTTQKDIAKALGLSPITVSRVFNDRGYISEKTRQQVLKYADAVGYTPDRAARALVRGTVAKLSIILTDHPPFFWNDVLRGIALAARPLEFLGFEVSVRQVSHRNPADFAHALEDELKAGTDALAVANTATYPLEPALDRIENPDLPVVLFSVDMEHPSRVCFVGPDYIAAGRLAAEAISKFAEKDSGIVILESKIDGNPGRRPKVSSMRRSGFLDWFSAGSGSIEERVLGSTGKSVKEGMQDLFMEQEGRPLAVYCISPIIEDVAKAIRSIRPEPKPILIGHDLSPMLIRSLSDGTITAEIFQDPLLQGFSLVKRMEQIAAEGKSTGTGDIIIPSQIVLAENGQNKSALELIIDSFEPKAAAP